MLKCDGYAMFHGTVKVKQVGGNIDLTGTWLHRPEVDCWYCQPQKGFAASFLPEELTDFRDEDPDPEWEVYEHGYRKRG